MSGNVCPRTLDIAVDYAIQIESQKATVKILNQIVNNVATDDGALQWFRQFQS